MERGENKNTERRVTFYVLHVYCPFDGKCLKKHGSKTSHKVSRQKKKRSEHSVGLSNLFHQEKFHAREQRTRQGKGEEKVENRTIPGTVN